MPRNTAYIGEALPFEIRLYVDARVRAQLEEMPEITAEGCTVQKTTKPDQIEVSRNGEEYVMVTYKSAVTPAKAGEPEARPGDSAGGGATAAAAPEEERGTVRRSVFPEPVF